jgi:2-iminobutanoate/2-iminopropanoate deaminase
MTEPIAFSTPDAPRPAGAYSQAIRAGDFLFVSGQVPRSPDGTYTPASVADETRLTLLNLAAIVAAAGGTLADTVKITAYVADGAYVAEFNSAYSEFFAFRPPARTTITAGLREVKVELDAIVYLPAR